MQNNSKSSATPQSYATNITIHKSKKPISFSDTNEVLNWQPMSRGTFNLGGHGYAFIRIQLDPSRVLSPDGLVVVVARNNIFTDAMLHYQHENVLEEKLLTPSTTDNKLLSIKLDKETINTPIYLSISGRYLRGELLIVSPKEFTTYIKNSSMKDGIYFGIISLILFFSLLSFVILRQTIFIKYSALLTVMFLWVAAGDGWLKSTFPQIQELPFFTPNALGLLFFIAFVYFSYDYLKLAHTQSKAGQLLKYNQLILFFIWLCYCVSYERANPTLYQIIYGLALLNCLIVLAVTFIIAIRSWPSQRKQSAFYLCALIVFIVSSVISGLSVANIIDYYTGWTLIKVSSLIEVFFLASGLIYGYKVALTKQESKEQQHNIVQEKLISTQQQLTESNAIIESKKKSPPICPQIAKVIALLDKALFIRATGNYAEIVYQNGANTKELLIDTNLQAIENTLDAKMIIRCHKSYMVKVGVNFRITRRSSADYDLTLKEHRIPVGRKYLKDIRLTFNRV